MARMYAALFVLLFSTPLLAQHDAGLEVRLPDEAAIVTSQTMRASNTFAKANAAFTRFLDENPGWEFRYDALNSAPHRAWGAGIRIDGYPAINLMNAPQAGKQFVRDHAAVLNAQPGNLRMLYSEIVDGKAYQKFTQTYNGLDVLNSYVDLRISRDGRVFMFGSDFKNGISVNTTPSLGVAAAKAFATAGFDAPPSTDRINGGTLYVLPLRYPTRMEYRLVYNFVVEAGPDDVWNTFVDAHSGTVLWRKNLVVHFHGKRDPGERRLANTVNVRVTGNIYKDSWLYGGTVVPMPNMYVNVGGKEYVTDADGRFTADLGAQTNVPVIARLTGPYSRARRADSSAILKNAVINTFAVVGNDLEIVWDSSNSVAAARNVVYHMTAARNYIRSLDVSDKMADIDRQITGVVNVASTCNANWDGSKINFFSAGGGCGNTGEIPDVIYHEYGHAINQFLYTRLRGSGMGNGTLGEATADINANMIRDDPRIGIGFRITGDDGLIRNSDNNRVFPQDLVNEIHDDGMILSGAVWDMRKAIGIDAARALTHKVQYGTPDGTTPGEVFADYFIEILVADDDDGNLANGTPHSAQIIPAFVKHGIPASGLSLLFNPLGDQSSVTNAYSMSGDILIGPAINQNLLTVAEINCYFTTDDWATNTMVPMTVNTSTKKFSGSIPAQRAGSIVRYYYECKDNYGSQFRVPALAPAQDYLFLVGFESKVFYDCETLDGWTTLSDISTGKWTRAKPNGTYSNTIGTPPDVPWIQPNVDRTVGLNKDRCWVTGNAAFNTADGPGLDDMDDGYTNLFTKNYDITNYREPVLRYFRWYSNDQGNNPGADFWTVRISSDGGATWKEIENTNKADASWQPHVFRLRGLVALTDKFQVQFSGSDSMSIHRSSPGSLVEAAVDDFELLDVNQSLINDVRDEALPTQIALEQNYPNPFNPSTTIAWSLPAAMDVRVSIYPPLGTLLSVPVDARQNAGRHTIAFDAATLPSGVYTCELLAGGMRLMRTMVVMK